MSLPYMEGAGSLIEGVDAADAGGPGHDGVEVAGIAGDGQGGELILGAGESGLDSGAGMGNGAGAGTGGRSHVCALAFVGEVKADWLAAVGQHLGQPLVPVGVLVGQGDDGDLGQAAQKGIKSVFEDDRALAHVGEVALGCEPEQ